MKNETKLSQRMTALNLTDKSLAEVAKLERSMITKMRLGAASPSLRSAIRVCDATGLRPEDLFVTRKPENKEAAE